MSIPTFGVGHVRFFRRELDGRTDPVALCPCGLIVQADLLQRRAANKSKMSWLRAWRAHRTLGTLRRMPSAKTAVERLAAAVRKLTACTLDGKPPAQ